MVATARSLDESAKSASLSPLPGGAACAEASPVHVNPPMHRGKPIPDVGGARVVDYGSLLSRSRAVYERINAYRRYFDRHQHKLAVFAATYVKSTQGVLEALESDSKKPPSERFFQDPGFIVELTERFSHRYFVAMHRIVCESKMLPLGDAPPATQPRTDEPDCDPWRKISDIISGRGTTAYIDFVYGALVHINYDLPIVLSGLGLYASEGHTCGRTRIDDFKRFNAVLSGSIDAVQKDVIERYDRGAWVIDALAFRLDERIGAFGVRRSREQALADARRFASGERDPLAFGSKFVGTLRWVARLFEPVRWLAVLTRTSNSRVWPPAV